MLVFVYGTLKKGEYNHDVMLRAEGAFVDECETANKYHMYNYGGMFPAVVPAKGEEGTHIKGELYDVMDIKPLDILEGCPQLYYKEIINLSNGEKAWMYLYNTLQNGGIDKHELMPEGQW